MLWLLILFKSLAVAGLGPSFQGPPVELCLLDFSEAHEGQYTDICSGVLVSEKLIITAAHCLQDSLPREVFCQGQRHQAESFEIHPNYQKDLPFEDSTYQRNDLARLYLSSPFRGQNISMGQLTQKEPEQCFFAGYSKLLGQKKNSPHYGQWEVEPEALESFVDLIVLRGLKGRGALVEPGDSGGALFCRTQGEWQLLGIISGRDYNYNSLFIPLDEWSTQGARFKKPRAPNQPASIFLFPKALELGFPLHADHYFLSPQAFEKKLRHWLIQQQGYHHRLQVFSEVEVFEKGAWLSQPLYDAPFNYLKISRVHGSWVYGELRVLASSQSFPVVLGESQEVRARIEDLELILLSVRD